jgi:hypothetical protein
MPVLASDICDDARVLLNDVAIRLYDNTTLRPMLSMANQSLEQLLAVHSIPIQRMQSVPILVVAGSTEIPLPTDFLIPIRAFERIAGQDSWNPMKEMRWNPENFVPQSTLNFWQFSNNKMNVPTASGDVECLLEYERMLATVFADGAPIDDGKLRPYLSSKTAEMAARFIGLNESIAEGIRARKGVEDEDNLIRLLVLNQQGIRVRRPRFTVRGSSGVIIRQL